MNGDEIEKWRHTVLYLLRGCRPIRPGATALLKMLFSADYEHYREHLRPITGATYVALERGPVVNDYRALFTSMVTDGLLKERRTPILGLSTKKIEYQPTCDPDDLVFSDTEIETLDHVIGTCKDKTGRQLSDRTHYEGPWQLVWDPEQPGREIPHALFRWLDNLPDEEDLKAAKATADALSDRQTTR